MHMIRNAVDHGIESPAEREIRGKPRVGTIRLSAARQGSSVVVELTDDGRGLDDESIKKAAVKRGFVRAEELSRWTERDIQSLIFAPGFSTSAVITDISGRGVGMDVVRINVERLKGTIVVESIPGKGCTVRIQLPATLVTSRVLIVNVQGGAYALPLEYIQSTCFLNSENVFTIEGRPSLRVDDHPVSVARLCDLLEFETSTAGAVVANHRQPCVILSSGRELLAVIVDELLDVQEVIMKTHGGLLKRVRNVAGSAILATGAVCTVLNPSDLIRSGCKRPLQSPPFAAHETVKQTVLLVEDSITTRTWEKRALESAGYEVVTAVDGVEALQKLEVHALHAIVSDIQMPNMDGLTLTEKIRQNKKHKEVPVILVTSLADDSDRKRGIEAGANAYITKPAFDQRLLIETLKRLV
jgi:two-component system chemotaxis sensor kinase CheA